MGGHVKGGIAAFAAALGAGYVNGDAFGSEEADELWLALVVSGSDATSVDVEVHWSPDGGTTFCKLPGLNSVAGGLADVDDLEIVHDPTNGNHSYGPIPVPSGCPLRVAAKRTGGTGATLAATAVLISTGR